MYKRKWALALKENENSDMTSSSGLPQSFCLRLSLLVIKYSGQPHKFLWSHLQFAIYALHVNTPPSCMPPMQFTRHFRRGHLHPVYFRKQVCFQFIFCSSIQLLSSLLPTQFMRHVKRNLQVNIQQYFSFKIVPSNHRIISAKIHLSLQKHKKQTGEASQYDWSSLANNDISNQYTITVRNKFDSLQEISEWHTPNDKHKNFLTTQIE